MNRHALIAATTMVGFIVGANYVTEFFGKVPAGFGMQVTAGTYLAGLTLGLRDVLHRVAGARWRRWVLSAIGVGAVLSFTLASPQLAIASAVAFTVAELADLGVYAPLVERRWWLAVALSSLVGSVLDSVLFLWISPFDLTLELLVGQVLVKAVWMGALALGVYAAVHRTRRAYA